MSDLVWWAIVVATGVLAILLVGRAYNAVLHQAMRKASAWEPGHMPGFEESSDE